MPHCDINLLMTVDVDDISNITEDDLSLLKDFMDGFEKRLSHHLNYDNAYEKIENMGNIGEPKKEKNHIYIESYIIAWRFTGETNEQLKLLTNDINSDINNFINEQYDDVLKELKDEYKISNKLSKLNIEIDSECDAEEDPSDYDEDIDEDDI